MYCKKLFLALSYICAVLTASQIFADTYIVDPTGTYKTIQSAYTAAGSGDTILLTAGYTYTGSGNINLTFAKDLTLGRTGDGTDPIIDMEESSRFCTIASSSTVTMSNLDIRNGRETNGAAIVNNGTLIAFSCTFSQNRADPYEGGAIHNNGTFNATECTFSDNSVYGGIGGAITNLRDIDVGKAGIVTIADCIFSGNNAIAGGAIINRSGIINATGCIFGNNNASEGGAIVNSFSGSCSISCCRFVGNTVNTIYNPSGTVTATNCWWGTNKPNTTELFGDTAVTYEPYIIINLLPDPLLMPFGTPTLITADFTKNNEGSLHSCTIMNNTPVIFSSSADVVITTTLTYFVDGQATTTMVDTTVTDTFTFCAQTDTDLSTTGYNYCETATPYGFVEDVYISALRGDDNNPGTQEEPIRTIGHGLAILNPAVPSVHMYLEAGNTFTGTDNCNQTITLHNLFIAPYGDGADPIIDMENQADTQFCYITPGHTITISHVTMQNGNNSGQGGAISNEGILYVSHCTFNNNIATRGGALTNKGGTVLLSYCTFNNNSSLNSGGSGGALYNETAETLQKNTVHHTLYAYDTIYANNSAALYGGAIYNLDDTVYLIRCTFTNNEAPNGGAIANRSTVLQTTVSSQSCTFIENNADSGGVLYNEGEFANAIIHCSSFAGNTAISNGAAIDNESTNTVQAQDNWWNSNADPATITNLLYGAVDADPWITTTLTAIPLGHGDFTIVATFSSSCIPDGTPIAFGSTEGTITPTATTVINGTATAQITGLFDTTADVWMFVGTGTEAFEMSLQIQGSRHEYQFLANSTVDISTGTRVIYSLDWCQQRPGSSRLPLLAAGGAIDNMSTCSKPNIFVYALDYICHVDYTGDHINPRIFTITDGSFDSPIVNAVQWCCDINPNCPMLPCLAVGGKTSGGTNTRVYYIDPSTFTLESFASAPVNGLSSVSSLCWNPESLCQYLTVGGCQQDPAHPTCNIIAYKNQLDELVTIDNTLFDTNVTALDCCKPYTATNATNKCAYFAVSTTGTRPCTGGWDTTKQIAIYKGLFAASSKPASVCAR